MRTVRALFVGSVMAVSAPAASATDLVDLAALLPQATDSAACDINPGGLIVGTARVAGDHQVAARWTMTSGETLDSIFGSEFAKGISDGGVMVGRHLGTGTGRYDRDGVFDCIPLPDPRGSFNNIWRASSGHDIDAHDAFTGAIVDLDSLLPPVSDRTQQTATAVSDAVLVAGYGSRDGLPGRRAFVIGLPHLFSSDVEGGGPSGWSAAEGWDR